MSSLEIVTLIALGCGCMLILAAVMGFILGWANKAFHVPVDPKQAAVDEALPGANCGGCGYIGCSDYAEAVAKGEAAVDKCPVGGSDCTSAIATIMGVSVEASWPQRPIVHCAATAEQRLHRAPYRGESSCHAANLVAGTQGCTYGCLGEGDCVDACDYDAIHVVNGLATVDYEACVGCGACAGACPRRIISIVPFKAEQVLAVTCANQDFGKEVSSLCTVGCIGCSACARNADVITMDGKLPTIDYTSYEASMDFTTSLEKCPREALVWVGTPSAADLVAAAGIDAPERAEADFASTVDQTEWRG